MEATGVNTGTQDTKQVNFTVNAAPNQTLTPAADKTDANQKNAVKTGDNTPILPFVIILIVAIVFNCRNSCFTAIKKKIIVDSQINSNCE